MSHGATTHLVHHRLHTTCASCLPSYIVRFVQIQSKAARRSDPTYVRYVTPAGRSAMASRSALMALLVVVSSVAAASAATFTVGDSSGWTLGGVNYDNWANGKTFAVGDQLVFNFATGQHDVVEVDKSGYDGCSTSNALSSAIQNGPATVTLTAGTHYYICGISGHCGAGMKLAVTVGSGSGSPSTPPTPSTPGTPATPSAPAPGGTGTPGSASVRLTAGPVLAVAAAVLLKLALF